MPPMVQQPIAMATATPMAMVMPMPPMIQQPMAMATPMPMATATPMAPMIQQPPHHHSSEGSQQQKRDPFGSDAFVYEDGSDPFGKDAFAGGDDFFGGSTQAKCSSKAGVMPEARTRCSPRRRTR